MDLEVAVDTKTLNGKSKNETKIILIVTLLSSFFQCLLQILKFFFYRNKRHLIIIKLFFQVITNLLVRHLRSERSDQDFYVWFFSSHVRFSIHTSLLMCHRDGHLKGCNKTLEISDPHSKKFRCCTKIFYHLASTKKRFPLNVLPWNASTPKQIWIRLFDRLMNWIHINLLERTHIPNYLDIHKVLLSLIYDHTSQQAKNGWNVLW